jgi:histidinol-phosphate/aromatic aminotransferase/cobyric acid decarboxylase-like protein
MRTPSDGTAEALEPLIPPAGEHGGDGAAVAAALGVEPEAVLDLSATLNPFAPDVPALAARHLGSLRRYPDVGAAEALVAGMVGAPGRLVLTAGAAQAIALVADRLEVGRVDEPEFSLYRRHLRRLDPAAPRWRSDPHSPSGRLATPDVGRTEDSGAPGSTEGSGRGATPHDGRTQDRRAPAEPEVTGVSGPRATLHDGRADATAAAATTEVWDEAYLPMSAGTWTRGRPGWAIGSLTKAFACPGLRIGYAIAPDEDAAADLRRRRPAWAVDGLACALVPELVTAADPPTWTRLIGRAREDLVRILRRHGLAPEASDAPWVLVGGAAGLRTALALRAVVVRDCSSFGLPDHVRISVPDPPGLDRLDRALAAVLESFSPPKLGS